MDYLDLQVDIATGPTGGYEVHARSPIGSASATLRPPWDDGEAVARHRTIQHALLGSATSSPDAPIPADEITRLGRELFDALIPEGAVRERFEAARSAAESRGLALRIRLDIDAPTVASLPWEYLADPGERAGLAGTNLPLVRQVALGRPIHALGVSPPLRILTMIASQETGRVKHGDPAKRSLRDALAEPVARGDLLLSWLVDPSWRELKAALAGDPWHVFHLIGRGGFDTARGEGYIQVRDEAGGATRLAAGALGRLLGDHEELRVAVLTSNDSADMTVDDFAATATTLVQRGVPSVVAIPYALSRPANRAFSTAFYGAVTRNASIGEAIVEARGALLTARPASLDWGAVALFAGAPDEAMFDLKRPAAPAASSAAPLAAVAVAHDAVPRPEPAARHVRGVGAAAVVGAAPAATAGAVKAADRPVADHSAPDRRAGSWLGRTVGMILSAVRRGGYISGLLGAEIGAAAALLVLPSIQKARVADTILTTFWPHENTSGLTTLVQEQGLWIGLWILVVFGAWISLRLFRASDAPWTTFLLAILALVLVFAILAPALKGAYGAGDTAIFQVIAPTVLWGVAAAVVVARGVTRLARTGRL